MKNNKINDLKFRPKPIPVHKLPSQFQVGDACALKLQDNIMAESVVLAVRFAKNKISYDLNVKTIQGVIPVYNVDSKIVAKINSK